MKTMKVMRATKLAPTVQIADKARWRREGHLQKEKIAAHYLDVSFT